MVDTVDAFIAAQDAARRPLFEALRSLVRITMPEAAEALKLGGPCYLVGGKSVVCLYPSGDHVRLGFFEGAALGDPDNLLEADGEGLKHIKFRTIKDVWRPGVAALLRKAGGGR